MARKRPGLSDTDRDRVLIDQRWPSMTLKEKVSYIFSYYGVAIVCVVICLIFGIWLIRDMTSGRSSEHFYVMVLENEPDYDLVEQAQEELLEILEPLGLECDVYIETGYDVNTGYQMEATISTYMQAGRVDLVVAGEELFNRYAATAYLASFDELGLTDLAAAQDPEDLFYAVQADYSQGGSVDELPMDPHNDSGDGQCYGIYVDQGLFEGMVIGVMVNSEHAEYAGTAIRYFLGEDLQGD